jgi:hypothetical protein
MPPAPSAALRRSASPISRRRGWSSDPGRGHRERRDPRLRRRADCARKELAEQVGAVRQELAEQIGATRTELLRAINRSTFWMNGFLAALLIAVLGMLGVPIGKL